MKVETAAVAELQPYEHNPRIIPDSAIRAVANSIEKFGWRQPIVVDSNNVVVVGHTRLKAAELLGMDEVPITRASDLTEDEINAYRLLDNRVGELTTWDPEVLERELGSINFEGLNESFDQSVLEEGLGKYDFDDGLDDLEDDRADGYANPIIQYVLIFDDEDQQEIWNGFLRSLKLKYDDMDTHSERIIAFINEKMNG